MVENLENRRKAEALQLILGQFELADGLKVFQGNTVICDLRAAGHNGDIMTGSHAGGRHLADRRRDAVHIFKRVGEPRPLLVF